MKRNVLNDHDTSLNTKLGTTRDEEILYLSLDCVVTDFAVRTTRNLQDISDWLNWVFLGNQSRAVWNKDWLWYRLRRLIGYLKWVRVLTCHMLLHRLRGTKSAQLQTGLLMYYFGYVMRHWFRSLIRIITILSSQTLNIDGIESFKWSVPFSMKWNGGRIGYESWPNVLNRLDPYTCVLTKPGAIIK